MLALIDLSDVKKDVKKLYLSHVANKDQQFVPLVISIILTEPRVLELLGDRSAIIHVPIKTIDSNPIEFSFRATRPGYQKIIIHFYDPQQQMYIEELPIITQVVTDDTTVESDLTHYTLLDIKSKMAISSQQNPSHNLTLEIREMKQSDQYYFDFYVLSSDYDDEYYPRKRIAVLPLKREPEKEIRLIIQDIEKMIRFPRDLKQSLDDKGWNLYESLFPEEIRNKYWEIKDKITSIHIFSDEPWIPWEILKPWKDTEGGDYSCLCEQYSFSRWPIKPYNNYAKFAAQGFQIKNVEVVIPSDTTLTNALNESELIGSFGEREGFAVRQSKSIDNLLNILDDGSFDLLHVSAHGKYDSDEPLLSYISIEEGRADFRAESIVGPKIRRTFGKTNPIVFLNACQSGSQGYSLTGIGGWAQQFINAGASAFIGTLWSVVDSEACQFTEDLYRQLCRPLKISEAVQNTRRSRNPGDVSRLAYVLFAPPNLTVSFNCKNRIQ